MQNTYLNVGFRKLGQQFSRMNIIFPENNAAYLSNMKW